MLVIVQILGLVLLNEHFTLVKVLLENIGHLKYRALIGIDGHNIDFLKNKVAFDLEWNSKDQTFDRDLLAMRTYFDCGLIDVGVIVTRAEELNDIFKDAGIMAKYGASTTWMGKLLYRLDSRRNGGCPILAVGIKKRCVEGYE